MSAGRWSWMVAAAVGCAKPVEPYALTLELQLPAALADQLNGADFRVDAANAAGVITSVEVGQGKGLPPLPDDTVEVTLVAERGGDLVAVGHAPFEGGTPPGSDETLTLAVAPFADLGRWASIGEAQRLVASELGIAADGRLFLFGGEHPDAFEFGGAGDPNLEVLVMDPDAGETRFTRALGGDPFDGGLVNHTVSQVEVDGDDLLLVAGGFSTLGDPFGPKDAFYLYDPAEGSVRGGAKAMPRPRAMHLALPFQNGNILFYGGFTSEFFEAPNYDIFDVGRGAFREGDPSPLTAGTGPGHGAGARLGADIVVCGGDDGDQPDLERQTWTPRDGCVRIRPSGDIVEFDSLPAPRSGLAMASIDGGVLAIGGFEEVSVDELDPDTNFVNSFGSSPGTRTTFRYSEVEGEWRRVGDLAVSRAHHAAVTLADGRVMVFGGTENGAGLFGDLGDPRACTEIFDPDTDRWSTGECGDHAGGAFPAWAVREGGEIALVAGHTLDQNLDTTGSPSVIGGSQVGIGAWGVAER